MGWLVLGGLALVAALLAANWIANADPKALARALRRAGLATGLVAGSSLLGYLALSGRFALLAPLAVFALPWARRRLMAGLGSAGFGARPSPAAPGQSSEVRTAFLRMSLDHDTG
ncbi:MAG: molecular chaperone DnaJ, partial [Proteobacteria bacterium]|nr:molecular chaperone DnaJ [Pseudomonadota bacterium]